MVRVVIALALSLGDELIKEVVGAVATGLFVAAGGGVAAGILIRKWEARREKFTLKTELVDQVSRTAQAMYLGCQHTRRLLRRNKPESPIAITALDNLHEKYAQFSADSIALEGILGGRYGVSWWLIGQPHSSRGALGPGRPEIHESLESNDKEEEEEEGENQSTDLQEPSKSDVFPRWHQIRDLLTVYYFNLTGEFPGDVLRRNSIGYKGRYHSGLELASMVRDPRKPTREELRSVREKIRPGFESAFRELVGGIIGDDIKTG